MYNLRDKVVWIDPAHETSHVTEIIQINKPVYFCSNGTTEVEALEEELVCIGDIFCCSKCGNIDIEIKHWVRATDLSPTDLVDTDECYCDKCEATLNFENLEVYLKNKEKEDDN